MGYKIVTTVPIRVRINFHAYGLIDGNFGVDKREIL